jgi:phosphatidylserine/phosphatidylglycerophosphate/cardiolipin synthase-like enzyme
VSYAEHRHGEHVARWLATIDEAYAEMERHIDAAARSVRLETYLLREEGPGTRLRAALIRARARGVTVSVLLDTFGTEELDRCGRVVHWSHSSIHSAGCAARFAIIASCSPAMGSMPSWADSTSHPSTLAMA